MLRSYKVRIYPTKEQQEKLWKHIGACRYIWNYMLELQETRYQHGEKYLSEFNMIRALTPLKKDGEHDWLYEVSNASLARICSDVNDAYDDFFKKISGYPKFKSKKRSKPKYPLRCDDFYFINDKVLHIPKVGKVKYKTDFSFSIGKKNQFFNPRVSFDHNKWYVSFAIERENQAQELTDKSMGIDLGIKELAVVEFNGQKLVFPNINKSKKIRDAKSRLKFHQRSAARKYESSKKRNHGKYVKTANIVKQENQIRRLYKRIADIHMNYVHQTTHSLVSLLPCTVVMQDLNVTGMMKNKHLARVISEQCLSEFIRQMQYKCQEYGIEFVQVNRFYPSSKTCSNCGCIKKDLKLSERIFHCPNCGFTIDRDYNAAINLSRYAIPVNELQP